MVLFEDGLRERRRVLQKKGGLRKQFVKKVLRSYFRLMAPAGPMCKEAGHVAQVVIQHINKYTFFGEGNINLRRKGAEWQTDLLKHERYLWDLYKIRPNFSISPKTWRTCMTIVWAERHKDWFSTLPPPETRESWIISTAAYNRALCRQAEQVKVKKENGLQNNFVGVLQGFQDKPPVAP